MSFEVKEYRAEPSLYLQHLWNYLDVIPKLLVLLSISLDLTSDFIVS